MSAPDWEDATLPHERDGPIDLRSDVLGTPTATMWVAMRESRPGWAYVGEDATVAKLEQCVARLLGQESALLVPTCSMANLVALMTLAGRGTQVVLGASSHIVTSEAWGVAGICGAFPRLVQDGLGYPDPSEVEAAIDEAVVRGLPASSVLCLENTHNNAGGTPLTIEQTRSLSDIARAHDMSTHLDGARLFNASVALQVPVGRLVEGVDSIAVSLNKGLGAPFGAILGGSERIVQAARLNLKRLGGSSIHQAGRWAAAALVALDGWPDRLADDHRRARRLAELIATVSGRHLLACEARTNIVLLDVAALGCRSTEFLDRLATRGVRAMAHSAFKVRLVTHSGIDDLAVERAAAAVRVVALELAVERRESEGTTRDEQRSM